MNEDPFAAAHDRSHDNRDVPTRVQEVILGRKVMDKPHLGLLISVFVAAFAFVGVAFALDPGGDSWIFNWFIATPCIIGSLASSLTFMRLIIGKLDYFTAIVGLCVAGSVSIKAGGNQWYLVAMLISAAILCSYLFLRFVVGDFTPVVRVSKRA